jgi:hypothetical protein
MFAPRLLIVACLAQTLMVQRITEELGVAIMVAYVVSDSSATHDATCRALRAEGMIYQSPA